MKNVEFMSKMPYNFVNDNYKKRFSYRKYGKRSEKEKKRKGNSADMVTLKDIAEKAGVSSMTVSRVMNGKTGTVSQQTSERIKKIAQEMGYVPNSSARALASRSSRLIAALLQEYDEERNPLEDSYTSCFLGELALQIKKEGYDLMLHYVKDYSEITYSLKSWNVAGAVFIGMFDESIRKLQEDNHIPLIFTDSYSSIRSITNVGIDDYRGGELAAEHFLKNGHRNVAFYGPEVLDNGVVMHRIRGFVSVLREAGISLPQENFINLGVKDLGEVLARLCSGKNPVTGIFTTADNCAYQIYSEAYRKGLRIPEDLSVIGFDDLSMSRLVTPPLTTVRQDIKKKALVTCDLLMKNINAADSPSENIVLNVELSERKSVRRL